MAASFPGARPVIESYEHSIVCFDVNQIERSLFLKIFYCIRKVDAKTVSERNASQWPDGWARTRAAWVGGSREVRAGGEVELLGDTGVVMDAVMPKKQTTAGKKARAAARAGEKYTAALRRQTAPGAGTGLEHRGFLNHAPGFRPFRDTGLFERIGGQPTIDMLVDLLYEGIADDDELARAAGRGLVRSRRPRRDAGSGPRSSW
jgi:hypothetical protein